MASQEAVVGKIDELKDGQMKQVKVGATAVLLARVDGTYHAVGNSCTHYGAPLSDGVLVGSRVVCPWHHSCYSVVGGELEEPPGLDSLPRYEVRLDGPNIVVTVPENVPEQRTPPATGAKQAADQRVFVIVGGGAAGAAAAEALREAGYRGRVVVLTAEARLPYDRTLLSKAYLAKGDDQGWIPMRKAAFYRERDIEIMDSTGVTGLDPEAQTLELADGTTLHFDAVLLAPGSVVRRLDVPGADLDGVLLLRTPEDSDRIVAAAKAGRRAVVIGASWIGMECAASLRARDIAVTVVAPEQVPFEKILGAQAGHMLQQLHEEHDVTFRLGVEVARLEGVSAVERVVLNSGETLEADFVVVGVGVRPATGFLGELADDDGGVRVDRQLRVANVPKSVWAAGDIARFPWQGDDIRIEHWRVAMQHGRVAAFNMAGREQAFDDAPFFWTQQYGKSFRYVGHVEQPDETLVDGDLDQLKALVCYIKNGQLRAALGVGRDPEVCAIRELMRLDKLPSLEQIRTGVDWVALLAKA